MMISANTRTRVVVLLTSIALTLVLLLAGAVGARADGTPVPAIEPAHVAYTVRSGDTLWDIAVDRVLPGDDVRVLIEDIRHLNGLGSSVIVPGQVLRIPVGG
jgi:Tfp pilus assembly protein FimV